MITFKTLSLATLGLIVISCSNQRHYTDYGAEVESTFQSASGSNVSGSAKFDQSHRDVMIHAKVSGLEPNSVHAIHIHEKGDCSAYDATSAGPHFSPDDQPHGAPEERDRHLGDLGNFTTDNNGNADFVVKAKNVNLDENNRYSILKRALVIHERHDDYKTQPGGDAGARIACAVIE